MAQPKVGLREAAKAEKEADIILQSLMRASESAVATTLHSITEALKANTPLMYHIHALLQNEEWKAVLETSALGVSSQKSGDKPVAKTKKNFRVNVKQFQHLSRHDLHSIVVRIS